MILVCVYSIIFFFPYTYLICTRYIVIHVYTYASASAYKDVTDLNPYNAQYSVYPLYSLPLYSLPPSYYADADCMKSPFNTESRPRSPFPTHGKGSGGEDGVPCAARRSSFKIKKESLKSTFL